jgi:hypothetical protein
MWLRTGSTWTKCGYKTMLLPLFLIWFVITYSYSDVWALLMNCCNKCCVLLNHYDLGWSRFGLKSLVISWTTGVIWTQVWEFDRFDDCFYTCALIIWTVPWHWWFALVLLCKEKFKMRRGFPLPITVMLDCAHNDLAMLYIKLWSVDLSLESSWLIPRLFYCLFVLMSSLADWINHK